MNNWTIRFRFSLLDKLAMCWQILRAHSVVLYLPDTSYLRYNLTDKDCKTACTMVHGVAELVESSESSVYEAQGIINNN